MVNKPTCKVEGCEGEVRANGMCIKHYMRVYRRGLVGKKGTKAKAMENFIHSIVSDYFMGTLPRDKCRTWKFYQNYWGRINGTSIKANSYIARMTIFKPEEKMMRVNMLCGTDNCINPHHMQWIKFNSRQKLTEFELKAIKISSGKVSEIAKKYGVSPSVISRIRNGKYGNK